MAYSTISKPSLHFNTKLYTGTGSGNQSVTGVGFQPDFVWTKNRASAYGHNLYDVVRGTGKYIASNSSAAEQTSATSIISFDSDGFTVGTGDNVQYESASGVSWNWKAGGGQGSSNTDGSINTTYTSANTTAGFSISTYTGTGSNATFGHGLGAAPEMVIVKCLNDAQNWFIYHQGIGATKVIYLDLNNAQQTLSQGWNNTAPTSSVVSIGTEAGVNQNGNLYVAYCFKEKTGYSKFGSYTGNGSSSSPAFIYTGFKPKFVIVKCTNEADEWFMHDDKRDGYNDDNEYLFASVTNVEGTNTNRIRLLSNGFSVPTTDKSHNKSGNSYIYMAFGQSIVGSNNVPCTAR